MSRYRPSELRAFLDRIGTDAKKSLSQNFLIDGNILRKIVKRAGVKPEDHILEIGPGPGALTEQLVEAGAAVTVVEKDHLFAQELKKTKELTVFEEDILDFTLPPGKFKIVANLPYHLTTPIIAKFIQLRDQISSMTIMVQKEVGERIIAKAKTPHYSHLSLFCEFYATCSYAFTIEPTCFYPPPRVRSCLVHLELKEPPKVDKEVFFKLTRTAFNHRRKMLRASLKELYGKERIENALGKIGINETARPEELSLDQFIALYELLEA